MVQVFCCRKSSHESVVVCCIRVSSWSLKEFVCEELLYSMNCCYTTFTWIPPGLWTQWVLDRKRTLLLLRGGKFPSSGLVISHSCSLLLVSELRVKVPSLIMRISSLNGWACCFLCGRWAVKVHYEGALPSPTWTCIKSVHLRNGNWIHAWNFCEGSVWVVICTCE